MLPRILCWRYTVEKTVKALCKSERYRPVIINLLPSQDSNLSHFWFRGRLAACARSCPCKVVTNPILLSSQLTLTADLITEELYKLNSNTDKEPKKKKVKKLVSRAFDLFWLVFISAVCTIYCAGCMSFFSFTETVNVLLTGRERVSKMTRTKEQCSYKEWQLFLNCYRVRLTLKNHIDFYQPCLGPWPGTCTVLWREKRRERTL